MIGFWRHSFNGQMDCVFSFRLKWSNFVVESCFPVQALVVATFLCSGSWSGKTSIIVHLRWKYEIPRLKVLSCCRCNLPYKAPATTRQMSWIANNPNKCEGSSPTGSIATNKSTLLPPALASGLRTGYAATVTGIAGVIRSFAVVFPSNPGFTLAKLLVHSRY